MRAYARFAALVLLSAITAIPVAASAEIIQFKVTGEIGDGVDGIGIFGAKGGSLAGLPFILQSRIDTSVGRLFETAEGEEAVQGGSFYKRYPQSPLTSTTVTINGKTEVISSNTAAFFGSVYSPQNAGNPYNEELHAFGTRKLYYGMYTLGDNLDLVEFDALKLFDKPRNAQVYPGQISGGFDLTFSDNSGERSLETEGTLIGESVVLTVEQPVPIVMQPVPEASTWTMMLLGLGYVGLLAFNKARKGGKAATVAS